MDPWIAETKPKKYSWKAPKTTTIYHNFPKHSFPRVIYIYIYIYMYHLYHWFTTHFLIKWFKCVLMWKSSINARFSRKPRLHGNWKHVALTLRRPNQWVVCMELISGGNHRQKPSQYAKSHVCITGWWWLEPWNFMTFHIYIYILGPSSSQVTLTPSFFRGVGQPPTSITIELNLSWL